MMAFPGSHRKSVPWVDLKVIPYGYNLLSAIKQLIDDGVSQALRNVTSSRFGSTLISDTA
jgi:hypothetical protein